MKKILAIVLALVLVLTAFACAEENEDEQMFESYYNVEFEVPAGYTFEFDEDLGTVYVGKFIPDDENAVQYLLIISYSEEFNGYTLNDYTEEEFAAAAEALTADYEAPIVGTAETGMGTKLITVIETGSESFYGSILTIYQGFFVQVHLFSDYEFTDADMQVAIDILTSMELSKR